MFVDLRASRQSKRSKSYVNGPSILQTTSASPPSQQKFPSPEQSLPGQKDLYAPLPINLQIQTFNGIGRGIVAKEEIRRGTILISVEPHVFVLSSQCLDAFCSFCAEKDPSKSLSRCARCRTVWYCNTACQNADWDVHKRECSALRKWETSAPSEMSVPGEAVRCLGRILWKRKNQGAASVWSREMDGMQSHRGLLSDNAHSTNLQVHIAHSLVRYLSLSSPSELAEFGIGSASDLVDFISRFTTNTFTLSTPTLTPIGISISPLIALINHSCDPNAVVVFPHATSTMQIISLRQIAANEEVLTSYVDTTLPLSSRQASLRETYNFTCSCPLCARPPRPDPRESMWCSNKCGGTCPLPVAGPTQCVKCNTSAPSQYVGGIIDAVRIGEEALVKATAVQFSDPPAALRLTTNMLPILVSAGLVPSSHPLLAMNRLHQSLLIATLPDGEGLTREKLNEAVRVAARSSLALDSILVHGHPMRGIAQSELGKLLAVDEPSLSPTPSADFPPSGPSRLQLAYESLIKSLDELLIGFGTDNGGGDVGREVREMTVRLERELGLWRERVKNVLEDTPR